MKRIQTISLIFSLLFSLLSVKSLVVDQIETRDINYSIKSTVTYVNPRGGTKIWNLTEEDRTIGLFINNTWQSVELKNTTYPLETLKNDTDRNKIAVLRLPKQQLSPGENVSYTVRYNVVSKPRTIPNISENESGTLEAIPPDLRENYTRAEGPWLANNSALAELAHEIAGSETKVLKIIKGLVGWIKSNINYSAHEIPYYPNETLSAHEGDCDDQAILFITLSRIMGIPSYLQIGAIYLPQNMVNETYWDSHVRYVQRKISWHGWAIAYVPPWGWLPVDLTYVTSEFDNPLSAIRHGAILGQNVIQYMDFSKVDYVADSRQTRNVLLENGFFEDLEDEMTVEVTQNGVIEAFDPSVTILLVAVIVILLIGSLWIVRRWLRRFEEPKVPTSGKLTFELFRLLPQASILFFFVRVPCCVRRLNLLSCLVVHALRQL